MTTFSTQEGFNSVAISSLGGGTYLGLLKGFNGIGIDPEGVAVLRVIGEDGNPFSGTVTATISYLSESYQIVFLSPGQAVLYVFTDANGVPVEQSISLTDGVLSQTYTVTPVLGSVLELALTRVFIDALSIVDAIGNIETLSVSNALLIDTTGWDGDSPKTISFPGSGGASDEPAFYFGREPGHLKITADITYEVVIGRPITESFEINLAP